MSGYGFTSAGTAYDDEDRLTGYQQASTNFNQSWSLTSVGDWSSVTTNGTAVTRTHGPTHELLTSGGQNVTTDVKGNQTVLPASLATQAAQLAFAWDYDNKLKSSDIDNNGSADVMFEYDALGRRVARTEGSTAVVYFQADQQTIADYPRGGAASTATYRYVFASYIDEPVVRKTTGTSGTVLYYHRNQQYSIYALTDSSGNVSERYAYTAYGQPIFLNASATVQTSSAAGNRYTYTAREWDATLGLHHFRARWMSGLTGRFLNRDPIGYVAGSLLYVAKMTVKRLDPLGLDVKDSDCQTAADTFLNGKIKDFKAGCAAGKPNNIVITCKPCKSPANPNPPGGETHCSKDKKTIEITICSDRFNDMKGIERILNHEFQHAKDYCSCKGGCDMWIPVLNDKGLAPDDFCAKIACLELRACKVADCAGKTGTEMHDCMINCAAESMNLSKYCKKRGIVLVLEGRDPKCVGSDDEATLPPFPY